MPTKFRPYAPDQELLPVNLRECCQKSRRVFHPRGDG